MPECNEATPVYVALRYRKRPEQKAAKPGMAPSGGFSDGLSMELTGGRAVQGLCCRNKIDQKCSNRLDRAAARAALRRTIVTQIRKPPDPLGREMRIRSW